MKVLSKSPQETLNLGHWLGRRLSAGDVVALSGVLGSGKSVLARGILRAVGVVGDLPSPSFVIVAAYQGRIPVYHIDLYRVETGEQALGLGLEDLLFGEAVCVIEWAERIGHFLPASTIRVVMELRAQPDDRLITLTASESGIGQRLASLAQALISFDR